jgi:hypothetical protein
VWRMGPAASMLTVRDARSEPRLTFNSLKTGARAGGMRRAEPKGAMSAPSRLIAATVVCVSAAMGAPAGATPPAPPIDLELIEATSDGVMSLPDYYAGSRGLAVEVDTEAGEAVDGSIELVTRAAATTLRRVLWRPAAPLEVGASYRVRVYLEPDDYRPDRELVDEITLRVLDQTMPPVEAPVVDQVVATEEQVVTTSHCCDPVPPVPQSSRLPYEHCWAQAYDYPVDVDIQWHPSAEAERGVVMYEIVPAPLATLKPWSDFGYPLGELGASIRFPSSAGLHCVDLVAHDLVRGSSARTRVCAADVLAARRSPPEAPDLAVCEGDLVVAGSDAVVTEAPAVEEPDEGTSAGGCSAGGGGSGALIALLAIAFAARRSRPTLAR